MKIRLQHPGGWYVDRIPAWIKWATVEAGKMGAKYDGIHWAPPQQEQHRWRHPRPPKPPALRIYEAHVGMSGEEPRVTSYREFTGRRAVKCNVSAHSIHEMAACAGPSTPLVSGTHGMLHGGASSA